MLATTASGARSNATDSFLNVHFAGKDLRNANILQKLESQDPNLVQAKDYQYYQAHPISMDPSHFNGLSPVLRHTLLRQIILLELQTRPRQ